MLTASGSTDPDTELLKEHIVSLYIDNNVVQADIDRRYELAGVDIHDTTHRSRHGSDLPSRPLVMHPLAAFFARLVGGSDTPRTSRSHRDAQAVTGRPRHP
jgi:hypothetical protein